MFRKSGLVAIIITTLLFGGIFYLAKNSYLTSLVEMALESSFGAKSEIESVTLDLLTLNVEYKNLSIADKNQPMQNLFVSTHGQFKIDPLQLFARKVVIDELTISGVQFGTARKTSGALPIARAKPVVKEEAESDSGVSLPKVDIKSLAKGIDTDKLIETTPLQSTEQLTKLEQRYAELQKQWQASIDLDRYQQKYDEIEKRFNGLKDLKLSSIDDIKKASSEINQIKKDITALKKEIKTANADLKNEMDAFNRVLDTARDALKQDISNAKQTLKFEKFNTENVGAALFGDAFMEKAKPLMKFLPQIKAMLKSDESAEDETPYQRRVGVDIAFKRTVPIPPSFLIRHAAFEGYWPEQKDQFDGDLYDFTLTPKQHQKATTVNAKLKSENGAPYLVKATLDHRAGVDKDRIEVTGTDIDMGSIKLSSSQTGKFPVAFDAKGAEMSSWFEIEDGKLNSKINIDYKKGVFRFGENGGKDKDIRAIFDNLDMVTIRGALKGSITSPSIDLNSNLDKSLSSAFKELYNKRITEARAKLEQSINARYQEKEDAFKNSLEEQKQQLLAPYQQKLDQFNNIEQRLDDEKQKLQARIDEQAAALQQKLDAEKAATQAKIDAEKRRLEEQKAKLQAELEAKKAAEKKRVEEKLKESLKKKFGF